MFSIAALLLSILPLSYAAETVLGVFIFHRHGDRTAKSTPPANLTNLGYSEVLTSGTYYRNRYISSNAPLRLNGVSSDIVKQSQISASAPADVVLTNSCAGFLQGFFPPVGSTVGPQTLRDGTVVESPFNGFQLIPIGSVSTGANSEDTNWLQDSTNCANAKTSSNEYFYSPEYQQLLNTTQDFYNGIYPVINRTFNSTMTSYKNAYTSQYQFLPPLSLCNIPTHHTVFDLINVAEIHNATIQSPNLITPAALTQRRTLADAHEYNLAWNVSSPIRAIAGMTLAAQVVDFFNTTITTNGASKMNVQFGNYATFTSFFGLANLLQTNADFYGVPDYTSSMAFELFTNYSSSSAKSFPPSHELNVRFLFHNGTASPSSEPSVYPLFGRNQQTVSWNDFTNEMAKFTSEIQRIGVKLAAIRRAPARSMLMLLQQRGRVPARALRVEMVVFPPRWVVSLALW